MKISEEEVKHIASLARLKFEGEDITKLTHDLAGIVEFAEKLNEVDVEGVTPTAHILNIKNIFRKDEVKASYNRDELFKNAPTREAGCISVPRVVE